MTVSPVVDHLRTRNAGPFCDLDRTDEFADEDLSGHDGKTNCSSALRCAPADPVPQAPSVYCGTCSAVAPGRRRASFGSSGKATGSACQAAGPETGDQGSPWERPGHVIG